MNSRRTRKECLNWIQFDFNGTLCALVANAKKPNPPTFPGLFTARCVLCSAAYYSIDTFFGLEQWMNEEDFANAQRDLANFYC